MAQLASLRIRPEKVAAVDRKAADSELDRTKYILRLVDEDLARPTPRPNRRFASGHLLGKFRSQGSNHTQVRAALRAVHR